MKRTGRTAQEILADLPLSKTSGRWSGILLGLFIGCLFTVVWVQRHPSQTQCYGSYFHSWIKASAEGFSFEHSPSQGISLNALRYALYRYGNEDHQYDHALLFYHLYPSQIKNPAAYVRRQEAWPALYDEPPILVWQGPLAVFVIACFLGFGIGQHRDEAYRKKLRVGIHVEGSRLLRTKEYHEANRGDGIAYAVYPRETERKVFYL